MAPESGPGGRSGASDGVRLGVDTDGSLADLLSSSPVDESLGDGLPGRPGGRRGAHEVALTSAAASPGPRFGDLPPIGDVLGVIDLAFGGTPSLSRIHEAGLGEDLDDELAALFLPLEPDRDDWYTDRGESTESRPRPDVDWGVDGPALDPDPGIAAIGSAPPAPPPAPPADRGPALEFNTETVRPDSLRWSTVVYEPAQTLAPAEIPAFGTGGPSMFPEPRGRAAATRAGPYGAQAPMARGTFIPVSLLDAADRRWFWGAIFGAMAVSCALIGFVAFNGDGNGNDADAAVPTTVAASPSTGEPAPPEGAASSPAPSVADDQGQSISAEPPSTTGPVPAAGPSRTRAARSNPARSTTVAQGATTTASSAPSSSTAPGSVTTVSSPAPTTAPQTATSRTTVRITTTATTVRPTTTTTTATTEDTTTTTEATTTTTEDTTTTTEVTTTTEATTTTAGIARLGDPEMPTRAFRR